MRAVVYRSRVPGEAYILALHERLVHFNVELEV
jgi:hypothetical protein